MGIFSRQCLGKRRIPNLRTLRKKGEGLGPAHESEWCLLFGHNVRGAGGDVLACADHAAISPNHLFRYLQPFLSIVVVQIFFIASLFLVVAALTRKIAVVYLYARGFLQGLPGQVHDFLPYRSLEHFWSSIFNPIRRHPVRQHHALLDGARNEHAPPSLGFQRVYSGRCE
jgi:hypothetical protein